MFHIDDHAISDAELAVWKSTATISEDGFIYFDNAKKYGERHLFNACDILLYWETGEIFGLQRIRVGNEKPLGRKGWRHVLEKGLRDKVVKSRREQIESVFLGQTIKFDVLGWHPLNVVFWRPGLARRLSPPTEKVLEPNEAGNIYAAMAKTRNG